jgi:hypothetical protein
MGSTSIDQPIVDSELLGDGRGGAQLDVPIMGYFVSLSLLSFSLSLSIVQ